MAYGRTAPTQYANTGVDPVTGQAPLTPEQQAEQDAAMQAQADQAAANVSGSGASLGALNPNDLYGNRSTMRPDQTNAERIAQQQSNFMYGGFEGGADAHAAMVRNQLQPISTNLQQYGGDLYGQAAVGGQGYTQGMGGLYDQANALNAYAQQGPGPSVAQAQLDANTAMAMRGQLALAGSGRGQGGGASQFRQAAANQAQIAGAANAQASMLQAQEAQDWRQAQMAAYGTAGQLYGQGAGLGGQYAGDMGGLAINAQQGAAQATLGQEQIATDIYGRALQGTTAYENNMTDTYAIDKGAVRPEDGGSGIGQLVGGTLGAVAGTYFGPAGTVAGGALGSAIGSEFDK
jgi:hypothetical protein